MTTASHWAPAAPSSTTRQAVAALVLTFMGLVFFSIAAAGWAIGRFGLPGVSAADLAELEAIAPFAVAVAAANIVLAVLAIAVTGVGRQVAAAASAATAVAFTAGAVAVAFGWDIFQRTSTGPRFVAEGISILGMAALIYAAVSVLLVRAARR